ncbi:hemolysin family protein [Bacillus mojavensis]|uniref:hemolysin family protein n=1 Tax=Bacillus mojavensis TaxID=72360 RepID=UPI002DBA0B06|nr:hemolysin family protein [Bacillus mojavensis]MEC1738716.1 hemolysin family protein [Bacillus mojavensis]MEC1793924.1 hemolysin family protein [Bacillus mojavensis]
MDDIDSLILIGVLIALTAFFVASEFAIVRVRRSKIDQLITEGNKRAILAKRVITDLDEYLSASQLGITVTSIGLGVLGEPAFERLLHPLFEPLGLPESVSHAVSFAVAYGLITFLHVVVGELAPKTVAIQKAEQLTLLIAGPLRLFYLLLFPFIWILNGSARLLCGMFGLKSASEHEGSHSEEELRMLLSESLKNGEINPSEYKYVNKIFEFDNRIAKEIMIPRKEMAAVSTDMTMAEMLEVILKEKYTRWPVTDGDKDSVIGLVNTKHLFSDLLFMTEEERMKMTIHPYVRPVIEVIETIPVHDLLIKMQRERIHMAILSDEYGGTSGLVTTEDILEEIVGEIRDEFDEDEQPLIQKLGDRHYVMDGKVRMDQVNSLLGASIQEDVDTIGGLILKENIDIEAGESIRIGSYTIKVLKMDGRLIKQIDIKEEISQTSGITAHHTLPMPEPVMLNGATLSEK